MVVGFTITHAISCELESRSGEVYSMQHCVIQFVSDLRQVVVFSDNKTDSYDIIDILLKVALINIILTPNPLKWKKKLSTFRRNH
jgi:hypothetical protein